MKSLVRWLYQLARIGRDVEVLVSGPRQDCTAHREQTPGPPRGPSSLVAALSSPAEAPSLAVPHWLYIGCKALGPRIQRGFRPDPLTGSQVATRNLRSVSAALA